MAGQANTPLPGYPQPVGAKWEIVFDHKGPSSYPNIGTNSGAGDVINATDLGFGGFEGVTGAWGAWIEGYSNSGNYLVKIFTSSATTTPALSAGAGQAYPKAVLQWFATSAAFGAISTEVANTTDLSAESVRLYARSV